MIVHRLRVVVVVFSCVGMILPTFAIAAPLIAAPTVVSAQQIRPATRDIALHKGGVLVGQLLNAQGVGVVEAPVVVKTAGKEIARVTTDKDGKFSVTGLNGGVHEVVSSGQQEVYRLWASRTAPPAARKGLMLVTSSNVVRGQCDCGTPVCGSACGAGGRGGGGYGGGVYGGGGGGGRGIGNWIADHPLITAGAIATAIAIPLALDDDSPASP